MYLRKKTRGRCPRETARADEGVTKLPQANGIRAFRAAMAVFLAYIMALPVTPLLAQGPPVVVAGPGGTINNSGLIPFEQAYFAFEVEGPLGTLKEVPIWDEIELMLDNPYQFAVEPSVAAGGTEPNSQGYPAYRLTQPRRRSFIYRNAAGAPCAPLSAGCNEVPLNRHVIHPLNYNHMNGEEMRLLNIEYEGGPAQVAGPLLPIASTPATNDYAFTYLDIEVSPGELRIEDDETAPDFNSPMGPRTAFTTTNCTDAGPFTECGIISVDSFFSPGPHPWGSTLTGEGAFIFGGQPGEPGYLGFGTTGNPGQRAEAYSLPAVPLGGPGVPGGSLPAAQRNPGASIVGKRLFDPVRGYIQPRPDEGAAGGLRRPSLRVRGFGDQPAHAGTPAAPDYLVNSMANLAADPAALLPSNENDYYRGATRAQKLAARDAAAALGKALFWDMQVGSDSVQACASCHFHAGVDNRTKGQINSGVNAGDTTAITVTNLVGGVAGANATVTAASFPLNKPVNPDVSADLLATAGSAVRITNDVLSSMGVSRFSRFIDIPTPTTAAAFLPASSGVASLAPDLGTIETADPVTINTGFRRVEPRHTPTFFGATLNFDNFWDGRARHDFNGGSVFGPSDPQGHVMVNDAGAIVPTRQIIRFASLASLATGPGLSEFEMSFAGRNWAKLGKKLFQAGVTPLANQLVSTTDSVLGPYSNQGGSACAGLPAADRSPGATAGGKPGLCINYPGLIKRAFYDALWNNTSAHLNGCYTDGNAAIHPNQCAAGTVAIPVLNAAGTAVEDSAADPFDNYVLTPAAGAAVATNTNQFTQMEGNMALFWGLSIHAWGTILMPDDTPFDRFMDENPETHVTFGESGEPSLVLDLVNCGPGVLQPCFTEVGNFKRDPGVVARVNCDLEGGGGCTEVPSGGTRAPGPATVDPLMGLDFFLGSNLSLKNRNFRSLRCGECHAGSTLTDHTVEISHQLSFGDFIQEFRAGQPGSELFPEPLGHGRVISGFSLEGELQENAQDGIERNLNDFCTIFPCTDVYGNLVPGLPANGFPQGQSLFDNGVYNIGVTPIGEDTSRGGKDAFGWPLSLGYLALKNLCGVDYSPGGDIGPSFAQPGGGGIPCPTFDPSADTTGGGVYDPTAQDQQINPGYAEEPGTPLLPPYLAPWASNLNVGDESNQDELFVGVNTIMREPILEGLVDAWGPFNPAAVIGEAFNNARQPEMATWPNVNRVNAQGAFKAAPLRNVELTNPYFHDGGNLTLRQQLDFYMRGGNFPITNRAHRDFLIMNLRVEDEALGGCIVTATGRPVPPDTTTGACPDGSLPEFTAAQKEEIIVSVVDFLLELTDERVAFERAPFDHPEIIVPIDGTAPENTAGRGALLSVPTLFRQVPAVGAGGIAAKLPNFLNITSGPRLLFPACGESPTNHYCK